MNADAPNDDATRSASLLRIDIDRSTAIRSPYPGLRPFEPSESDLFFGRDDQIDEMLACLETARFLAVVGASGCGKSSLVRAGLLPAVAGGFLMVPVSHWRFAVMRPGDKPRA